ncbi:hypothetical protein L0222_21110 [bacterium]|nr:hypothetical protein [bacterium]MCI0606972.1 hypothetical protein [bacterium]
MKLTKFLSVLFSMVLIVSLHCALVSAETLTVDGLGSGDGVIIGKNNTTG